jgi:hypothetical protein
MSENKKGFVIYKDWCLTILELMKDNEDPLTHYELGLLMEAVFVYQSIGEDLSKILPKHIRFLFKNIVDVFNRDLEKWEETREKRRGSGKMGGLAKASNSSNCQDLSKKEKPQKEEVPKVPKEETFKHGEHQRVVLTEKQYKASLEYYGCENRLNQAIQILDDYLEINPRKKYANHSLVLKNWVKTEVIKKHGWLDVKIDEDRHEILVTFENCDPIHEVDFIKEGLAKFPISTQKQAYETWASFETGKRFCAMLDTFNRTDIENKFQYALRLINDHTRLDYAIKKYKEDFKPSNPVIRM